MAPDALLLDIAAALAVLVIGSTEAAGRAGCPRLAHAPSFSAVPFTGCIVERGRRLA